MELVFGLLRLCFALRRDHVNPGSFLPHQMGRTFGEGNAGLPSVSRELRLYPDCRTDSGSNLSFPHTKAVFASQGPWLPSQMPRPPAEYGSLFSVSCCFTLTSAR